MKYNQFSAYVQDQINFSDRFRMTAGIRMEAPIYPELKNNYNAKFADLKFKMADGSEVSYTTDQLPDAPVTVSPRVGFNWDVLGNQKVVLRGGTGYFIGRLPFVWLVSAVSNSGCGQYQYSYIQADAKSLPTLVRFLSSILQLQSNCLTAAYLCLRSQMLHLRLQPSSIRI